MEKPQDSLGDVLTRLYETIDARKGAAPESSYTASLFSGGRQKCAKKFGEEAIETVIAAMVGNKAELAHEAADVLYHLGVLLAAVGVRPDDVAKALIAREGTSGLEEKASR